MEVMGPAVSVRLYLPPSFTIHTVIHTVCVFSVVSFTLLGVSIAQVGEKATFGWGGWVGGVDALAVTAHKTDFLHLNVAAAVGI